MAFFQQPREGLHTPLFYTAKGNWRTESSVPLSVNLPWIGITKTLYAWIRWAQIPFSRNRPIPWDTTPFSALTRKVKTDWGEWVNPLPLPFPPKREGSTANITTSQWHQTTPYPNTRQAKNTGNKRFLAMSKSWDFIACDKIGICHILFFMFFFRCNRFTHFFSTSFQIKKPW